MQQVDLLILYSDHVDASHPFSAQVVQVQLDSISRDDLLSSGIPRSCMDLSACRCTFRPPLPLQPLRILHEL
jgi:hypothetical protein